LSFIGFLYFLYIVETQIGLIAVLLDPNILNVAFRFDEISFDSIPMYLLKLSMVNSMFLLIYILKYKDNRKSTIIMFLLTILMNISVRRSILFYIILLNIFIFIY